MAVTLSPLAGAGWQFFDNNGIPLAGGLLYSYAAGTSTPLETYTSISGNIQNSNPIVLDSAGRVPSEIWITVGFGYKFVLKDANFVQIGSWDNIPSNASSPFANDASGIAYEEGYTVTAGNFVIGNTYLITSLGTTNFVSIGASTNSIGVYFTATGVGSGTGTAKLSRSVQSRLQDFVSVKDFGATGNGTTDDTAAIQAAINSGAQNVYFPQGLYAISAPLQLIPFTQLIGVDGGNTSGSSSSRIFALASFTGDAMILSTNTVDASGEKRYGLKNLFLNGANYVKNGVWWKNTNSGQIFNVSVVNVREYGFRIVNDTTGYSSNVTLQNCYVRMPNDQFFLNPTTYPIYAAYYIEGVFQVLINCISDGGQSGYWQGASGNVLTGQNVIQNCHFEGFTSYGIRLSDNNGLNQVIANEIVSIYDITNTHGVTNQLGIYFDPTATAGSNVISDNIIINPNNGVTYLNLSFGILTTTFSANNVISNNVIRNFVNGIVFQSVLNTAYNNSINTTLVCYGFSTGAALNFVNGGFSAYSVGYLVNDTSGSGTNKVTNLSTTSSAQQTYNGITSQNHPPVFSYYQNTTQSIPNLTATTITFDTKEFDNYSGFNTSTGIYSAPATGYYQINSSIQLTASTASITLAIYVQGSLVKQTSNTNATTNSISISSLVFLQKGWSMQIEATLAGPKSTSTGIASTWVSGCLVSSPF